MADNDQPIFAVSQECHQLQPWNENLNAKEDAKFCLREQIVFKVKYTGMNLQI